MTQHTPGPWCLHLVDDTTIIDARGRFIASVCGGDDDLGEADYNNPDEWPVMEANARLIAAAPDLASAIDHPLLRQLFGAIEDSGTPEAAKLWAICMAWFDVRDAAIAKIEGRS